MNGLVFLGIVVVLAILIGAILSIINTSQIRRLKSDLTQANKINEIQKKQILRLKDMFDRLKEDVEAHITTFRIDPDDTKETAKDPDEENVTVDETKNSSEQNVTNDESDIPMVTKHTSSDLQPKHQLNKSKASKKSRRFNFETFLMGNGLIWIGATVLALGGIFLAKYSIEAGLFPPMLRIIIGALFGITLIIAAEYLFQNPNKFKIHSPLIPAALASGGVITCFSITLVAFDFYSYLSPNFAFVILAGISIVASILSIRYGPVLAGIGVIGSYAVPALVSTGSNNISALLLYVSFVSLAALLVYQKVKVAWVWWLCLAGHLAWFGISLLILLDKGTVSTAELSIVTVFVMLTAYLFVVAPICGWTLKETRFDPLTLKDLLLPRKEQLGIFVPIFALIAFFILDRYQSEILILSLVLMLFLAIIPIRHSAFDSWPFIALFICLVTFLLMPANYDYSDNLFPFAGPYLFAQGASLGFILYASCMIKIFPARPSYLLLLVCAPLSIMAISYAISAPDAAKFLYPLYAAELGLFAIGFTVWALKTNNTLHQMTFLLFANGALSLIMTMLLSAGTLTLALAIQISLMAWLSSRYKITLPNWIYKIALAFVLARLSFAPWADAYKDETILNIHWTIVIYPLVCGLMWLARKYTFDTQLKAWFSGAIVHTVALLVTTETSYLLTGDYPNFDNLSYSESVLLGMNWLILSIVYFWRKQFSSHPKLYALFAAALLIGFSFMQIDVSFFNNPFISKQTTGSHFLINWLMPQWLIPALLLMFTLKNRLTFNRLRVPILITVPIFLILYVNGFIRSVYNEVLAFGHSVMSQAELYTYSIVWLFIAIISIVLAQKLKHEQVNKAGFIILALVVLKAFIVDMSTLEGLYRAVSFIGLGLSILGVAWLFQRLKQQTKEIHD
ncbi:DUF2339 domain-containing protein [Glaciecola petra]|uniref:DUF2339 domain-containing protein n=1 Tax=Glaciecola petra TaxID=3075602 RepID=A0ABU2ZNN9_9ALTE|nr:DUF2339 domain-containing protein [Aestuariibacter sp. P117]MDT0594240.1 DUF2339 domain-containing protein [Aestuariibacter sp. P117]